MTISMLDGNAREDLAGVIAEGVSALGWYEAPSRVSARIRSPSLPLAFILEADNKRTPEDLLDQVRVLLALVIAQETSVGRVRVTVTVPGYGDACSWV